MGETSSRRGRTDLPGAVLAIAALVAPLVLMPGLAWGADGRLRPVSYPADWLRARAMINASPAHGSALLLPWAAYRRYAWNHGEAVLDPWPRLLARTVIWNDTVQVGDLVVPGEDPTARGLGRLITSGASLTVPLRAAGVRFVIVDGGPDGPHRHRRWPTAARWRAHPEARRGGDRPHRARRRRLRTQRRLSLARHGGGPVHDSGGPVHGGRDSL